MGAIGPRSIGDARPYQGPPDAIRSSVPTMGVGEEAGRLIWEQFLTTRRIPEEIAGIVPGVNARQVRHVLRMGMHRPSPQEEERLRGAFVLTVPDPSRLFAAPGMLVSDITDVPGIEEALAGNRNAILALDARMAEAEAEHRVVGFSKSSRWWASRKAERSYLKAVMEALNHQRGAVVKGERQRRHLARQETRNEYLLRVIREMDGDLFERAFHLARERNPGLMGENPKAQAGQSKSDGASDT